MPLADIFQTFTAYGPVHFAALALILSAAWLLARRRRRLPAGADRRRLDVTLGFAMLAVWAVNQTLELVPWRYELQRSLPLHACDVVGLVAALALLTDRRVWRAMLYYWGIGLSTQALLTPELAGGLATFNFYSFWLPHGGIIALAVYDLAARGYRPGWRDYGIGVATLLVYLAVVLPFDLAFGVNYGYVGRGVPGQPSVIDFLGDWPGRTVKLCVAVAVFLALITLPWVLVVRRRADRRAGAAVDRPTTLPVRGSGGGGSGGGVDRGGVGGPAAQVPPRSPIESLESRSMI